MTKDTVVFNTDTPKDIGAKMDLEVPLPEDVLLDSFTLNGTITDCRHIRNNGTNVYMLEMSIGGLPEKNRLILDAYIDFLEREATLNKIKIDNMELQNALTNLGEKLTQLLTLSELLMRKAQGKIMIH